MTIFFRRLFYFITVSLLCYVLCFFVALKIIERKISNHPIILLGDSQTEFIHHPLIFNHSIHGVPFFVQNEFAYTFSQSLKGKTVIVALSPFHMSKLYQNVIFNDSIYPGWRGKIFKEHFGYTLFNEWNLNFKSPDDLKIPFLDISKSKKILYDVLGFSHKGINETTIIREKEKPTGSIS